MSRITEWVTHGGTEGFKENPLFELRSLGGGEYLLSTCMSQAQW